MKYNTNIHKNSEKTCHIKYKTGKTNKQTKRILERLPRMEYFVKKK